LSSDAQPPERRSQRVKTATWSPAASAAGTKVRPRETLAWSSIAPSWLVMSNWVPRYRSVSDISGS
jgi:hypothetical protein